MTKTIRFHETGGPEVLQYEDIDIGAPGEVRVKVEAVGLRHQPFPGLTTVYLA